VGTDKGLNKIDLSNTAKPIMKYTTTDGLPSNIINAIFIDSNKIFVGSPSGLTFFEENKISNYSRCNLKILDLSFSNKSRTAANHYELKHTENSLKVAFAGISFKSGGDILYRYRLKGLTNTWDSTRQTVLEYPSLPPGTYELQLEAINKYGKTSEMASIPFTINTPYWQTIWFRIGLVALVIGITWLLVARRFHTIRKREREKAALQQKMNDMEQMALRAQMNPHFIFNCLNSIQNFIINNNLEATNQYLTEFAYLIRQTLDNSDKGAISVSNETKYLTRYLELEKMRFGHSFDYNIEIDPHLDADSTRIPTMMLQPYVENCIRHGIRHKREGAGLVAIKFLQKKSGLLCIVEDNGIGREKAHEFKSYKHVEYQSKGMSLTADRINILNRQHAEDITIEVTDLKDEAQQARGTRVAIYIPGNILTKIR
jgi:two-component sensor histidine kinase